MSSEAASTFVQAVNCSKYSAERHQPECDERMQTGVGVAVVIVVLLIAIGYVLWRRWTSKGGAHGGDETLA